MKKTTVQSPENGTLTGIVILGLADNFLCKLAFLSGRITIFMSFKEFVDFYVCGTLAQIPTEANNLSDVCKGFEWEWWHGHFFGIWQSFVSSLICKVRESIFKGKCKGMPELNLKSLLRLFRFSKNLYVEWRFFYQTILYKKKIKQI